MRFLLRLFFINCPRQRPNNQRRRRRNHHRRHHQSPLRDPRVNRFETRR